jgi:hypothetical protein
MELAQQQIIKALDIVVLLIDPFMLLRSPFKLLVNDEFSILLRHLYRLLSKVLWVVLMSAVKNIFTPESSRILRVLLVR